MRADAAAPVPSAVRLTADSANANLLADAVLGGVAAVRTCVAGTD